MALAPGTQLGPYEVLALIGAGGMGEVYRARDPRLNREVAIKVLPHDRVTDPSRRQRFVQEAKAASALNHPHIITIHEIESADGIDFLVMEYVRGKSLDSLIPRQGMRLGEALRIAIPIADALTAAHARGIVHRDLKPANVMVGTDGAVKVLDFGLAKLLTDDEADPQAPTRTLEEGITRRGQVMGTLPYMSPEQASGEAVDARSDVFSFGAMLYEMVTGERPFAGKTPTDTMAAVLRAQPRPPSEIVPTLPREMERLVLRCLRREPGRRFQHMVDVKVDLQEIKEESDSGIADPPGRQATTELAIAAARRFKRLATVAMLAFLVTLSAAGWWAMQGWRARRTAAANRLVPRGFARLTIDPGLQTDVTWSPDGKSIAYASDKAGNFDIWMQRLDGGDAVQLTKSSSQDREPAWSPDGTTIVFRSDRDSGGLFVVPAGGGAERRLTSFGARPKWAPDGSQILFGSTDTDQNVPHLYTVRLDGRPPQQVLQSFLKHLIFMGAWNWYPDSLRVSVLGAGGNFLGPVNQTEFGIYTVPLSGGPPALLKFTPELGGWGDFAWTASGRVLYVDSDSAGAHNIGRLTVDPQTMTILTAERVTAGDGWETRLAPSSDGRHLAFTMSRMSHRLWAFPFDAATGRIAGNGEPVTDVGAHVSTSALTGDGSTLAYGLTRTGTNRLELWTTNLESGESRRLARDDQNRESFQWSRDGRRLAYSWFRQIGDAAAEQSLAVRGIGDNEEQLIVTPQQRSARLVFPSDWSPDGTSILATSSLSGPQHYSLTLWPVAAAPHAETAVKVLASDADYWLWQGKFSPDGRWICFEATKSDEPGTATIFAMPSGGAERSHWTALTGAHEWADKPRWSPDGKLLYFILQRGSFFNLWALHFDGVQGKAIGAPFQITRFDSLRRQLSPLIGEAEIGVSPKRLILTMMEQTGNIWMLDNVDR